MDETEKYKQRLEAIAEKRRQQEEQDRARREMEDERLRVKQLKRKSLRDQWLMDGTPLSPTSPDTESPHSPLWVFQAQEINKDMDKLQSESQQLAEEKEKLKEQMEVGQTQKTEMVAEASEEIAQDVVVQNGETSAAESATEDQVKKNQSPLQNESAAILTNGGTDFNTNTNHKASNQSIQSISNGPFCLTEDVVNMKLQPDFRNLGVSEAEPGHVPDVQINEEEEEGTLVMRAECVIITDEGDDATEDLASQEDQQETMHSEESPLPKPEASRGGDEAVEEVMKTEAALETFTNRKKTTDSAAETQSAAGDGDKGGDIKTNDERDPKTDAQHKLPEDTITVQLQSSAIAEEGTTVALVPVYSETQPSSSTPEAEGKAAVSPEGTEAALKAEHLAIMSGQFQEVPLADPQENQSTEAELEVQEPLLSQSKAHNTQAAPAVTNSPTSTETNSPTRGAPGEATEAPNRKTCQCCSIM